MAWHTKISGPYSRTSVEAIDNATEIYGILNDLGWTLNAITGILGNMGAESGYNPWRWQADLIGVSTGSPWTNKGYGLVQFTPGGKYINAAEAKAAPGYGPNFSDKIGSTLDGWAQMVYVDGYADYIPTTKYPLSYSAYKASEETPDYLARAWLYNYERPEDPAATENERAENAEYWYKTLSGVDPPKPPKPIHQRKLPIYYYLRRF